MELCINVSHRDVLVLIVQIAVLLFTARGSDEIAQLVCQTN
jgi:hypothetical protein